MLPFDAYPGQGRELLKRVTGSNFRSGYGRQFMQLTKQRKCAYCEVDLTEPYLNWLTGVLDHVIPASVCEGANIPEEWYESYSNRVLSCAACNGFCNRYTYTLETPPSTLKEFYDLRDKVFAERKQKILERHKEEQKIYATKPWEK